MLGVVNEDGTIEAGSLIDEIVREGARRMLAAALEAEVHQYIAEIAGQRDEAGRRLLVRNGRHRQRMVTASTGPVEVVAPRVNDKRINEETGARRRFSSKILTPWCRKSPKISELGSRGELDWTSVIIDAASVRAKKGSPLTGSNQVDRGKSGSKLHVLSDAGGIPLAVGASAANVNDILALKPRAEGSREVQARAAAQEARQAPRRQAYHSAATRAWLRERRIAVRIARPGIESSERLGRHRWKIERSLARLFGYRRLTVRYERKGSHFLALLGLAAALTSCKRLTRLTT